MKQTRILAILVLGVSMTMLVGCTASRGVSGGWTRAIFSGSLTPSGAPPNPLYLDLSRSSNRSAGRSVETVAGAIRFVTPGKIVTISPLSGNIDSQANPNFSVTGPGDDGSTYQFSATLVNPVSFGVGVSNTTSKFYNGICISSAAPNAPVPWTAALASTQPPLIDITGTYVGTLTDPKLGTNSLTLAIQSEDPNGILTGTVSVSNQGGQTQKGLSQASIDGNTVLFNAQGLLGREAAVPFDGAVTGNTISGSYRGPNGQGSFSVTKH